jgi:hypothetical protein
VFKDPRVVTTIMDKYPNLTDSPFCIRRDSLRTISEYTLNIWSFSKSVIKSYYTGGDSFKTTVSVGNAGDTPPGPPVTLLGVKKTVVVGTDPCPAETVTAPGSRPTTGSGNLLVSGSGRY